MGSKDVDRIANSVDPAQTAPLGAVWSGSTLFAQTCVSKNLGSLRYTDFMIPQLDMCDKTFSGYIILLKLKKIAYMIEVNDVP